MGLVVCRSPIDDKIVAERETMSWAAIVAAAEAARNAHRAWVSIPIADRAKHMHRFLDAMRDVNPDVTRELALQMGRPVRYGGNSARSRSA
jgi:acyl-CoA reductase-like NAD-dependent aldehyde dehydrogenase